MAEIESTAKAATTEAAAETKEAEPPQARAMEAAWAAEEEAKLARPAGAAEAGEVDLAKDRAKDRPQDPAKHTAALEVTAKARDKVMGGAQDGLRDRAKGGEDGVREGAQHGE